MMGNIGVVKSAMAELTDETNVTKGFSSLQMAWAVGYVIGSGALTYGILFSLIPRVNQPIGWWHLTAAARPLATPIFSPFLGRIPLLASMPGSRSSLLHIMGPYCHVPQGGSSFLF
jgi:hypothetical protein